MACVSLSRFEPCRRPLRLVGAVGIMLCLKCDTAVFHICHATFAIDGSVKEVAGIELDARLVGVYRKGDAGLGRIHLHGKLLHVACGVEYPVVVIAASIYHLSVGDRVAIAVAYRMAGGEVHCSALNGDNLAGGHESGVNRGDAVGIDIYAVVEYIARRVTVEVEIRVVGKVDRRLFVGCRAIGDVDCIVGRQTIGDLGVDIAGESVVTVGRCHGKRKRGVGGCLDAIYLVLPAARAAMKRVSEIVGGQAQGIAVDHNDAVAYAVGITAYRRTEIRKIVFREISLHAVEAEHDVAQFPFTVRHHD